MQSDGLNWLKAQELIKKELNNEQTFSVWFSPIKFVSVRQDSLSLEVPTKFFKDWLTEKYSDLLRISVQKTWGRDLTIGLLIGEPGAVSDTETAKTDEQKDKARAFWPFSKHAQATPTPKEIGLNPKYTFDSFVVGPSNRFTHAAAMAVCAAPAKEYNPLFIYGGVGLGKTHIMHAMGQMILQKQPRAKVLYISSEEFTNQLIGAIQNRSMPKFRERYRHVDILLIDDIQFIAGKESTQEEFFHTFNALHDSHKQIVVSSDRPPKDIQSLEERLVSRFAWGLVADIKPPDFETRVAILKKKSERETVSLPDDVVYCLAECVKSNIRELEGALIRVFAYAKLTGKDVSAELVKEVLKDMILEGDKRVSIDLIQKKVGEYFDIPQTDMKTKKRTRAVAYPRQIAMYLARQLTDSSLPEIGEQFGGRDHTTVIHACNKISGELKKNKGLVDTVDNITKNLKG